MALPLLLVAALSACGGGTDDAHDGARDAARADSLAMDGAADSAQASPPAPPADPALGRWLARVDSSVLTRWGACPFECCVYRDWIAEGPVVVRATPSFDAPQVAQLEPGARMAADTGFVRIVSAQLVVVTAPVEAYRLRRGAPGGGEPDTLPAGDTLLVLEPLGEGHFALTHGDDRLSAEQFWPGDDGWQPYGGARGETIGRHEAEWWAHVRAGGAEGWIDAYGSDLGNVDACGL